MVSDLTPLEFAMGIASVFAVVEILIFILEDE